ncbi:hypothetical protein BDF19DRAFT_410692 [Syncephalis fuscata]|nr:hypothetical protein BDF19DRAFT_410692 [Syncephalis fuscata]
MEVDISEKRYLVVHSASAPFSFVTKEIPNAFRADAFDVLTSTLISCGFFYNAYAGLVGYLKARHQRCPRNQNLMLLVNALQSFVCFCVGVLVLIHHCAPWIFECTVDLAACAIALSVSGGCVTAIMAAFAYQSAETTQGAHTLLAFGVFTVVATTVVDALAFKAMEMGITTFRNCTMTADSKTWIIGKLMVDLTTNLGLSLAYLNMLRKIVNDTGLPIYKVVFAHGLTGRFLVLASNLVCAILVASNAFEKWHVLIYSIDGK